LGRTPLRTRMQWRAQYACRHHVHKPETLRAYCRMSSALLPLNLALVLQDGSLPVFCAEAPFGPARTHNPAINTHYTAGSNPDVENPPQSVIPNQASHRRWDLGALSRLLTKAAVAERLERSGSKRLPLLTNITRCVPLLCSY